MTQLNHEQERPKRNHKVQSTKIMRKICEEYNSPRMIYPPTFIYK